ncbi:SIR2 family protein [Bacillus cereus]
MEISSSQKAKLISNIATDLLGNKVSLFVGAGFSADLGYPTWGKLLKRIIEKNKLMDKLVESNLFPLLREDEKNYDEINKLIIDKLIGVDFLRLAGYVDTLLVGEGKEAIRMEIKNEILGREDSREINEKYKRYSDHFDLLSEYIGEIITTNYDTNLEYCISNYSVIHRDLSSINHQSSKNVKKRIKIYKIHGCVTDHKNQIIITEKDYQDFSSTNKYISHKLYSTFMENNIVFIGYSLQDPNIRGILNEVIEEAKEGEGTNKKIYWVNRAKVNKTDKQFYKKMYSIEILDEIEILDFLEQLIILVKDKWTHNDLDEVNLKAAVDELLSFDDIRDIRNQNLINKFIEDDRYMDVLSYVYESFVTNSTPQDKAAIAYFSILTRIPEEKLKEPEILKKTDDILATEDGYLLALVEHLLHEEDVNQLFRSKGYNKKLLESFISRAKATIYFHQYELYSKGLLQYYKAFDGDIGEERGKFINAFYSNYHYLTDTKTKGYSYLSLRTVRDLLKCLGEDIIKDILSWYPSNTKEPVQKEQILALIDSLNDETKKNQMKYDYIYKFETYEMLERVIGKELSTVLVRENGFEWEDWDHFDPSSIEGTLRHPTDDVTMSIDKNKGENKEEIRISLDTREVIFILSFNQSEGTIELEASGKRKIISEVSEVKDFVSPILEQYFSVCGLLN